MLLNFSKPYMGSLESPCIKVIPTAAGKKERKNFLSVPTGRSGNIAIFPLKDVDVGDVLPITPGSARGKKGEICG